MCACRRAAQRREEPDQKPSFFLSPPTPLPQTLTGAYIFTADLVRAMRPPPPGMSIDFVRAASYAGTAAASLPRITLTASKIPISGRHVIVVEDIVDTGATAAALEAEILAQGAASVAVVALLDKPAGRARCKSEAGRSFVPAHAAFQVGDEFVVGYGLDWDEEERHWGYVGVVDG